MRIFESVKAAVTPRQAAEAYGLKVSRNGMTCCPFHEERHPSLKLNESYFFCFGCGASGDVIDFTGRLFGISLKDAAQKLAADFGISADAKPVSVRQNPFRLDEQRCRRAMTDYLRLQQRLTSRLSPYARHWSFVISISNGAPVLQKPSKATAPFPLRAEP